jgi:hypothetical protein
MPDKRCRVLRRRLSRREQLVGSCTRCKGEVHEIKPRATVLSDEVCVVVVIDHVAGPAGPVVTGAA